MRSVASIRAGVYCVRRASRTNEPGDWLDGKAETPSRENYRSWEESTRIRGAMAGGRDSRRADSSLERSMVLGTVAELKTRRIAQRLLDPILTKINSFDYRPSRFTTVGKFADTWESQVLLHQKPSSVKAAKSHLRTHIRKHLENVLLHELTPQIQQNFVTLLSQKGVSRKTVLNVLGILSSMMGTAKSWGYCTQAITTSELNAVDKVGELLRPEFCAQMRPN